MLKTRIEEKTKELVEDMIELEDKISSKERILKTCSDDTRHIHLNELASLEKAYNRKLELFHIIKG